MQGSLNLMKYDMIDINAIITDIVDLTDVYQYILITLR